MTVSLRSLRTREAASEGSIDEVALADNREYVARVFPMHRPIYLRGWAIDGKARETASSIVLRVDGSHEFVAVYGHAREDIANSFGSSNMSRSGFEAVIPPILDPGDHGVEAYAVGKNELECFCFASLTLHIVSTLVPRAFDHVLDGWAAGNIERFVEDDDVRTPMERAGRFEVTIGKGCVVDGWAIDRDGRTTLVEVGAVVDDRWFLQGNPGVLRRDIADAYGIPTATGCGFVVRFSLNFVEPGVHALRVVGRLANGKWVEVGSAVEFEAIPPALPWIWATTQLTQRTLCEIEKAQFYSRMEHDRDEAPGQNLSVEPKSGIFLSGWALDSPALTPAAAVYFSVDGDRYHAVPARYGLATHGLAAPVDRGRDLSQCGFTALIPTAGLAPGMHTLEPLIVASRWTGYYLGPLLRFEITESASPIAQNASSAQAPDSPARKRFDELSLVQTAFPRADAAAERPLR